MVIPLQLESEGKNTRLGPEGIGEMGETIDSENLVR